MNVSLQSSEDTEISSLNESMQAYVNIIESLRKECVDAEYKTTFLHLMFLYHYRCHLDFFHNTESIDTFLWVVKETLPLFIEGYIRDTEIRMFWTFVKDLIHLGSFHAVYFFNALHRLKTISLQATLECDSYRHLPYFIDVDQLVFASSVPTILGTLYDADDLQVGLHAPLDQYIQMYKQLFTLKDQEYVYYHHILQHFLDFMTFVKGRIDNIKQTSRDAYEA